MKTKTVCEALCAKFDGFQSVLKLGGVISMDDGRFIQSISHPELEGWLGDYTNPKIMITVNHIVTIFIIEPQLVRRTYPLIKINGPTCEIGYISKTRLVKELTQTMIVDEFMPNVNTPQFIWVDDYKTMDGVVLSMVEPNGWTTQDPHDLESKVVKMTTRKVVQGLLLGLD